MNFTACIVANAADLEAARPLSLEWVRTQDPYTTQTAAEMLPTPLSPTGEGPATHWMCCTQLTQDQCDHMQAFIEAHDVPVVLTVVGPQDDGHEYKQPNRVAFLAANGWQIVGAN